MSQPSIDQASRTLFVSKLLFWTFGNFPVFNAQSLKFASNFVCGTIADASAIRGVEACLFNPPMVRLLQTGYCCASFLVVLGGGVPSKHQCRYPTFSCSLAFTWLFSTTCLTCLHYCVFSTVLSLQTGLILCLYLGGGAGWGVAG